MKKMRKGGWTRGLVLGLMALGAAIAWSQGHSGTHPATEGDGYEALVEKAMETMHQDMASVPRKGDPDRDFAAAMIPHHQGAIEMAKALLRHGKDPELKKLAEEIVAAQEKEIRFLKNWLGRHGAGTSR